jgi:hypothetical protein
MTQISDTPFRQAVRAISRLPRECEHGTVLTGERECLACETSDPWVRPTTPCTACGEIGCEGHI